jgi:chromosome segregation ATPase
LEHFVTVFRQYAMPRPADGAVRLLAMQQDQKEYMRNFVEEVSLRTATQMEQAILRALLPVQRSMDNFIVAATQQQVEGMDRVAARFVERLDLLMKGQFLQLGETLAQLNAQHGHSQADLQSATAAISSVTQEVVQMHRLTQELTAQMDEYLRHAAQASQAAEQTGAHSAQLLDNMHAASMQQAKYFDRLQEYQTNLQDSMQQYTQWVDKLLGTGEKQARATSEALSGVTVEMQDSAALLQSSYASFVENIQAGLARALGMLDENIGGIAQDLNTAMNGIRAAVAEVPAVMAGSARKYGAQVDQFVEALSQLQKSMQTATAALTEDTRQKEVG